MPRISAASVEEHVRQQTERLLTVALELFRQRGFTNTDMGDIAAAMNLARSSLYRYYPNKEHILLAAIRTEMDPLLECFDSLLDSIDDPLERIAAWLELQIDTAIGPGHATLQMISEIRSDDPELRRQILEMHRRPAAILTESLQQIIPDGRDIDTVARLITGMVHSGAMHIIENNLTNTQQQAAIDEIKHSVAQVLGAHELQKPAGTDGAEGE